jgi:hypothetical protein
LDPLGIFAVVATSAAVTAWARKWRKVNFSKSTEYPVAIELVFERLHAAFSIKADATEHNSYKWHLKDSLPNGFITAELMAPLNSREEGDLSLNLTDLQAQCTLVDWSFRSRHRIRTTKAIQLEAALIQWLDSIVTADAQTPLLIKPKDDKHSHRTTLKTALVTNKASIVSPDPVAIERPMQDVYALLLRAWSSQAGGANHTYIQVLESEAGGFISANVHYSNPYIPTKFQGQLHIDLSEPAPESTRIRWIANLKGEDDRNVLVKCINEFVSDSVQSQEAKERHAGAAPYSVHVDFPCEAPQELAYAKIYQQITTPVPDAKWTLKECFKPRSIKSLLEKPSKEEPTACKAIVVIELRQLNHCTRIDVDYLFTQETEPDLIPPFVKLITDRMRESLR